MFVSSLSRTFRTHLSGSLALFLSSSPGNPDRCTLAFFGRLTLTVDSEFVAQYLRWHKHATCDTWLGSISAYAGSRDQCIHRGVNFGIVSQRANRNHIGTSSQHVFLGPSASRLKIFKLPHAAAREAVSSINTFWCSGKGGWERFSLLEFSRPRTRRTNSPPTHVQTMYILSVLCCANRNHRVLFRLFHKSNSLVCDQRHRTIARSNHESRLGEGGLVYSLTPCLSFKRKGRMWGPCFEHPPGRIAPSNFLAGRGLRCSRWLLRRVAKNPRLSHVEHVCPPLYM